VDKPWQTGGCLCGAIRYSCVSAPLLTAVCHCRDCQRQSGSAFSIVIALPGQDYAQQGETRVFHGVSDAGRAVERHFCPRCGSPILSRTQALADVVLIKAGTLDEPDTLAPTIEVFCDSSMAFLPPQADTEQFARSNI